MKIIYDDVHDLLYIRFDEKEQKTINKRIDDDIVIDIGKGNRIVGVEILNASKRLNLQKLLPTVYEVHTEKLKIKS